MPNEPLTVEQWSAQLEPARAKKPAKAFEVLLASFPLDAATARSVKLKRRKGGVDLVARPSSFTRRTLLPSVKAVDLSQIQPKSGAQKEPGGFRPPHLDVRPLPQDLAESLRQANRVRRAIDPGPGRGIATSVFSPDQRYTFADTAFPWSTCGRVDTAAGWGSGVLCGPRHLLTASHVVNWSPGNTAGWLKFTPLLFDVSEPFGHAFATRIFSFLKADPSDGIQEDECAFDYVVCTLDRRLGDIAGWMGSRAYATAWNGGPYWAHVGYPNDLSSGKRPAFIGYQPLDSTFTRTVGNRDSFGISHQIDVIPGQSGGPYFGWWPSEPWPRVVSTQSAQWWGGPTGPNTCGGGNPLPELVTHARTVDP